MDTIRKRLIRAFLAIGASVVLIMTVPGTATAVARDGWCDVGEFCLYWGSGRTGSLSDFNGSIPNYGGSQPTCYDFKGSGGGQGMCVKNRARSAWNRTTANRVTVYYLDNYGNPSDVFTPGQTKNLVNTYLNNASHRFVHTG